MLNYVIVHEFFLEFLVCQLVNVNGLLEHPYESFYGFSSRLRSDF